MKKAMKDKIIEVIENHYADDKGHYSFRNKTALRLIKANLNITYNDHWYTVKIYDETMKIYCNQKDFRRLEYFSQNETALKIAKELTKQHFKKELSPERKRYFEELNAKRHKKRKAELK